MKHRTKSKKAGKKGGKSAINRASFISLARDEELLLGFHVVESLLTQRPGDLLSVYFADSVVAKGRASQLKQQLEAQKISTHVVAMERFQASFADDVHQGVAAVARGLPPGNEKALEHWLSELEEVPFLVALDGIQDPHNLGACLRSMEAAGAQALILPRDNNVSVNATVRRVACGAAERVPVFTVTNLVRCLQGLQSAGIWVVGTSDHSSKTLYQIDLKGPLCLVFGNEGKGMRRLTETNCDFLAGIPMQGQVSSLNLSVAVGVTLFEALRQRQS